jgi:hypothetical protein
VSWFSKGFEEAEAQAASSGGFIRDFFLKNGEDVNGVRILDDESINIRAHFVKGKGWFTCIHGIDDEGCPLCEAGNKAQNQFVFNVIDPREYTDKNGKTHKNQVKLWRVGITLLRLLNKRRTTYGPYTTLLLNISKMGAGAWDIVAEKVEEYELGEGQELYEREEVLAPKSRKELLAVVNNSEAENDDDDDDDDDAASWRKS